MYKFEENNKSDDIEEVGIHEVLDEIFDIS